MDVAFFIPPTVGSKEDLMEGLAGRRTDLYQQMLGHLVEIAQYMDEFGYYGMGFTEHHLSVEGMTLSNSPQMLGLYLANHTKYNHYGALGHVLPVHDPLRVAAEIAMLDQMTQGRAFAGFARGVQTRWINSMAQHRYSLADNITDPEQYNEDRRKLYYENLEIILKAWDNDTFSHKGDFWTLPAPKTDWPGQQMSRDMGGRSLDKDGNLVEIGVAPAMYNRKRPTMFEPFSVSHGSIETAAANGLVPIGIMCDPEIVAEQVEAAQRGWAKAGVDTKPGERLGFARYMIVGETDEEAMEFAELAMFEWTYFFAQFGFNAVLAGKDEDWQDIPSTIPEFIKRGILFCGSPDTVNRQLEAALKVMPIDYLWLFTPNELLPQPKMMKHLELMTRKVLPNFTDKIGPNVHRQEAA
ncbi:LLM class flavin-dependent oxidoreductase [Parasphingopyxis algicola]|uniref:LLM class flavin-dependent oxidoreductase n=1 Tax=Parasphingopyxis algicola TaxID=2026624 RepID=UPI0015A1186A|nr:LLM class flavin-dependent oxidoreductase [Parasphingopyxis algicola]QLC26494.1 LLM class flavin-dependent oxidoreductase [Parasphingopyxis algicola]